MSKYVKGKAEGGTKARYENVAFVGYDVFSCSYGTQNRECNVFTL